MLAIEGGKDSIVPVSPLAAGILQEALLQKKKQNKPGKIPVRVIPEMTVEPSSSPH